MPADTPAQQPTAVTGPSDLSAERIDALIIARRRGWDAMSGTERAHLAWACCGGFEGCDFRKRPCRACREDAQAGRLTEAQGRAQAHRDAEAREADRGRQPR